MVGRTVGRMLTDNDREVLDFAKLSWRYEGARVSAIRERFGISANVYAMRLGALIERADALEYAPQLVNRLLRLRDARRKARVRSHA